MIRNLAKNAPDEAVDVDDCQKLWSSFRFELFKESEMDWVVANPASVPKSLLLQHVKRMSRGANIFGIPAHGDASPRKRKRTLDSTRISLPIPSLLEPKDSHRSPPHFFRFHNWVWSAHFTPTKGSFSSSPNYFLVLRVVRRERRAEPASSFHDEVLKKVAQVTTKIVFASGHLPEET